MESLRLICSYVKSKVEDEGAAFLAVPVPTSAASTVRWSFRIRAGAGYFLFAFGIFRVII
jgi:hypothetical protein